MDVDPREYENVKIDDNDVRKIVLGYLIHNCFKETAETFIASTGMNCPMDFADDIDKRKSLYNCVMEGDTLKAIELTKQISSELLSSNRDLLFDLLTIHYIELIRARNRSICKGALEFAQRELTQFGNEPRYLEKMQDCLALLAYPEPEASPMFHLLNSEYRQSVADALNLAVLAHANLPSYTSIERLLQHVETIGHRLQELNKRGAPAATVKSFLKTFLKS